MSEVTRRLRRRHLWLLAPSMLAPLPLGVGSVYYAWLTLELPPLAGRVFHWIVLGALAIVATWSFRGSVALVPTLRALGRGELAPTPERLARAAREVQTAADKAFRLNARTWIFGVLVLLGGLELADPSTSAQVIGRLALCSLALLPLGASTAYLLTTRRARTLLPRFLELGLTPAQLAAATSRYPVTTRVRMMVFSVVLTTPSLVIADLVTSIFRTGMERVQAQADVAAQLAAADQAFTDAFLGLFVLGSALFVLTMFAAWLAATAISNPMRALADQTRRLADGDLRDTRTVGADDEQWTLSVTFTAMREQLSTALGELQGAGLRLSSTTEQLVAMASAHQTAATGREEALQHTSANTDSLAAVASGIAQTAQDVAARAEDTLMEARASEDCARAFVDAMNELQMNQQEIAEASGTLREAAAGIREAVRAIATTGDRAELLALSADLEGAAAGSVGHGFSLVAAEIRRLGRDVVRSTQEIALLLEQIREATEAALAATATSRATTAAAGALGQRVLADLAGIVSHARTTSRSAGVISGATSDQRQSSAQLAAGMSEVLALGEEGGAANAALASATIDLVTVAADLKRVVERFQLPPIGAETAARRPPETAPGMQSALTPPPGPERSS